MLRTMVLFNTLFISFFVYAEPVLLAGKVTAVIAGDLVTFSSDANEEFTIRLEGIDAPETSQEFGDIASKKLDNLLSLSDYKVEVSYEVKNRLGQLIGTLYSYPKKENKIPINKMLVEYGYAWAYRKYSSAYINEEEAARKDKLGLWANNNPIAPWEYREKRK